MDELDQFEISTSHFGKCLKDAVDLNMNILYQSQYTNINVQGLILVRCSIVYYSECLKWHEVQLYNPTKLMHGVKEQTRMFTYRSDGF